MRPGHCKRRRHLVLSALPLIAWPAWAGAGAAAPLRILVLGDSLSAEYGLPRGRGWVSLLEQRLRQLGPAAQVINASLSGETTAGGRTRLPALLREHQPGLVIIELGANDALRGLALTATQRNLQDMVRACKASGAKVLLVGMQVPPNYGKRYADDFAGLYAALARSEGLAWVPFLLAGVADRPDARDWFQGDAIHPLAKAHPIMLDNVWKALAPLLAGRAR